MLAVSPRRQETLVAMAKHRLERVNELLKRELGEMIRRDFVFEAPLVTVQQVDVTPDLKHAHVYLSVIGSPGQQQKVLSSLLAKRGALQHAISRRIVMKYTPQLHFKMDTGIERGNHVIRIMDELNLLPETESPRHSSVTKSSDTESSGTEETAMEDGAPPEANSPVSLPPARP